MPPKRVVEVSIIPVITDQIYMRAGRGLSRGNCRAFTWGINSGGHGGPSG